MVALSWIAFLVKYICKNLAFVGVTATLIYWTWSSCLYKDLNLYLISQLWFGASVICFCLFGKQSHKQHPHSPSGGWTIALQICMRVSFGTIFLRDQWIPILADILGIMLLIWSSHLRLESINMPRYLEIVTLCKGSLYKCNWCKITTGLFYSLVYVKSNWLQTPSSMQYKHHSHLD